MSPKSENVSLGKYGVAYKPRFKFKNELGIFSEPTKEAMRLFNKSKSDTDQIIVLNSQSFFNL